MSKSKYNGVDPAACIAKHGADCTRAHILFSAPVSEVLEWNEQGIVGMERWLGRAWRVVLAAVQRTQLREKSGHKPSRGQPRAISSMNDEEKAIWQAVQRTVLEVTKSLSESYSLNTVISDLIKLTNVLDDIDPKNTTIGEIFQTMCAETLVKLMAPVTPAFAEECWQALKRGDSTKVWSSVFEEKWPEVEDESIFDIYDIKCAVQIDGKTKFVLDIPTGMMDKRDEIAGLAVETPEGQKWLKTKLDEERLVDIVLAPGARVINFVFKEKKTGQKAAL